MDTKRKRTTAIRDVTYKVPESVSCSGLGQLENGRTFFRYGGIYANFACNPGLSLFGHVSSSCVRGRWRKSLPVCIASGCHMPAGIAHGILQTSNNDAIITVTCKEGYKLIGSSMIYCDGKRWNTTIPTCRETDVRGSSLPKKNSETERTLVVKNTFKKDPKRCLFNDTQNIHKHSEIVYIPEDLAAPKKENFLKNTVRSYYDQVLLKMWGQQRQLQSPKTFLGFKEEKHPTQPSLKELLKVTKITSTAENIAQPHFRNHVTSSYSWSSTVTEISNSKTSQIKAIPHLTERIYSTTPGLLGFKNPLTQHSYFLTHEKKVSTASSVDSPLNLRKTASNSPQLHQQIPAQYLSTLSENKPPAKFSPNNSVANVLAGVLETISETITPLSQLYNATQIMTSITNFPEDTNIDIKANEQSAVEMLTGITSSPVQVQTAQTPIVEVNNAHLEVMNTTGHDTGHNVTSANIEYKETLTESTNVSKLSDVKLYSTQKTSLTRTPEATTATTITNNSRRNRMNLGILIRAFRRRVQCVYPPLPSYGTFRFLTIKDPLPNQYPYYIKYSCYPGYTMSTGDLLSFCKDNGEWSGLTPVCELEENILTVGNTMTFPATRELQGDF
ncbi:uncharacterized protein ACNLHF_009139 [Anomaloglossus baeobatrachus]